MNKITIILKIKVACLLALCSVLLFSCQKDEPVGTIDIAKVNVIHGVVGAGGVKASLFSKEMGWSSIPDNQAIGYGKGKLYVVSNGQVIQLKAAPVQDTARVWYNRKVNLKAGTMYTLYLSGTPGDVDTLFHAETSRPRPILRDPGRPVPAADSVVNIRFVNLSASGPAVDIHIMGQTTKEASGLGYQKFTDFKAYMAKDYSDGLTLEIRNALTKEVIAYSWVDVSQWGNLFRTISLVIVGTYDPDWSLPIPDEERYMVVEVPYNNPTN